MIAKTLFILVVLAVVGANATIYFKEDFSSGNFDRWTVSKWKDAEGGTGTFELSAGKDHADPNDKGLRTTENSKFYTISAPFDTEFSNKDKDLVIQYSVKHEQGIDCGGAYVKIHPAGLDQANYNGDSEYNIMFGPDICGSTRRTHVIFNHNGKNHLIKKDVPTEKDELSHLYTLIVRPDNTFEVRIDNKEKRKGSLETDFDILPPKEINDPNQSKPADWVDEKEIDDPEDKKPEGWDDIPAEIVDPDAKKPDDWDTELDGEWEAPTIPNPEYKGEWKPRRIPNPEYKGEWVHPQIPNPEYKEEPNLYAYDSNAFIGIEVWQVKAGTIFDDFLVTDSVEEAEAAAEAFLKKKEAERKVYDERKAEETRQREEERKQREAEEAEKAAAETDTEAAAEEEHKEDL